MENVSKSVSISKFQVFCYLEANWTKYVVENNIMKKEFNDACQKHFMKYFNLKKNQIDAFREELQVVFDEWFNAFEQR